MRVELNEARENENKFTLEIEVISCKNVISGVVKSEIGKAGDDIAKETSVLRQRGIIQYWE